MFSNMLRTLGIRIATTIISLLIIVVVGQTIGAEALGIISLLILAITIMNLIGGFIGGAALVYLIPRNEGLSFIAISQVWAIFSGILTTIILFVFDLFPRGLVMDVLALGIIGSLIQNNMSVLLSKQRIKDHNFLTLLQAVLMILALLFFTLVLNDKSVMAYVHSIYVAYIPVLIISFFTSNKQHKGKQGCSAHAFRILFSYGSLIQISSILALLTYRLTYYYTEAWLGLAALGVLSVAAQISEAVWILPRSIALVQFSKISNLKSDSDSANLTFFLGIVTMMFILMTLTILVFIPNSVYVWIFGNDFQNISPVVQTFLPGIFAISINIILSNYFSGTGRIMFNLIGSAIGLLTVAIVGYFLINGGDVTSAALVSTLGYGANVLFACFSFLWATRGHRLSFKEGLNVFQNTHNV